MLNALKEKMLSQGMKLLKSPAVAKMMESEKMGVVIEKAMSVPFKVSSAITAQRERIVTLFDLATQQDLDEVKRTMARVEDVLHEIKKESSDLLRKVEEEKSKKPPIAE